ncbi:MAG: helix-turn-helix domain-containing protein [Pseudomonadota bacterium]
MKFVKSLFNESTKIVNMEMNGPEKKFAVAALAVFKRFGVRKATMEEIAAEAGVSKPTLYATFRNKDAALGGAIRYAKGEALRALTVDWAGMSLPDKLDMFKDRLVLAGFDMLHAAPDPAAFENAVGEHSQAAIDDTRAAEVAAVAELFASARDLKGLGTDAHGLAEFIVSSAMNAKRQAQNRDELESYLKVLKAMSLKAIEH